MTVDPRDSQIVYAATSSLGVLKSVDGGTTFVAASNGLPTLPDDPATYVPTSRTGSVQINPLHRSVLYVGTEGGGVYRSSDGADSWQAINAGLDDPNVFGLALDPVDPDILYASTNSSVFRTRNARP